MKPEEEEAAPSQDKMIDQRRMVPFPSNTPVVQT